MDGQARAIGRLTPGSAGLAAVVALNQAHAAELSPLTAEGLAALLGESFHSRQIGTADAFLIGFDQDADYASPNFLWFRARHPRFAYVDRVAVAPHARGRGLARRLYEDFFAAGRAAGHEIACCEVNILPPNPASDAFHARLGFRQVGSGAIHGGARTVRYLEKALDGGS